MANLIITVIAIALVAVASLMGAYYGGSAFLNNQSAADASTTMNQGQQIAGAWQAYLGDNLNTPPNTDVSALVTKNYLASWPQYPASAGGLAAAYIPITSIGSHYYALETVGLSTASPTDPNGSACDRVIKTATGTAPTLPPAATMATLVTSAAAGNATFGCGLDTSNTGTTLVPNLSVTTVLPTPGAAGTGWYVTYYKLS